MVSGHTYMSQLALLQVNDNIVALACSYELLFSI